jgi:hypothetical protein
MATITTTTMTILDSNSDSCEKQGNMRHNNSDGRHDNSKGQHGDGKRQQGDRRHDDGGGWHDETGGTMTGGTTMAKGSRATGCMMTVTGGTTTGVTMTARGRKRQQHHHHQRTNRSTIVRTFTSPDNLDFFKLVYSI